MAQFGLKQNARPRVVVATGNAGKIREYESMLGDTFELVPQSGVGVSPIEETGSSFLDNAMLKARHAAEITGLPTLADDSGLEVDALGGAPGVHSARYAGPNASDQDNREKLLAALAGVGPQQRGARFRCVIVWLREFRDAEPLVAEGTWEGRVAEAPRGRSGFGYDPIFVDEASGKTAAELDAAAKNALSHRGQAVARLADALGVSLRGRSPG